MRDFLKHHWFSDRNYGLIYLHRFFFFFAEFAAVTYRPGYFYAHGMTIPIILLSVALSFAVSALLSPFAYRWAGRHGILPVMAAAMIVNVISYAMAGSAGFSLEIAFLSNIFAGAGCTLYYSISDVLEALYVKNAAHRGRQFSFGMATSQIGMALGVLCGALIMPLYGFAGLAVVSIVAFAGALAPIALLDRNPPLPDARAQDVIYLLKDENYRPFYLPFFGMQLWIIMQCFIPLFLYIVIGDVRVFGMVVALAVFVQLLVTLAFGHYIDFSGYRKALFHSFLVNSGVVAGFLLLVKGPASAFLAEFFNRIAYNAFNSAFMTMMQEGAIGRRLPLLAFGAACQMTLCLFEVPVLFFYALVAWLAEPLIFPLIFLGGAAGAYLVWRKMPEAQHNG